MYFKSQTAEMRTMMTHANATDAERLKCLNAVSNEYYMTDGVINWRAEVLRKLRERADSYGYVSILVTEDHPYERRHMYIREIRATLVDYDKLRLALANGDPITAVTQILTPDEAAECVARGVYVSEGR
jgi:hypothetical protein